MSWTHYRLLLKVESEQARLFYMQETVDCNWSTRTLERQIGNLYYERMLMSQNTQSVREEAIGKQIIQEPKDIIKDPYVLEFLGLKDNTDFRENELEQAIIDKLQRFLQELRKGFAFVGRQYRLTTETGKHFYTDLVFYNYILKFFLIIDLKAEPLTHQDIGQMDMYVRYFEDRIRQDTDNPTIGLILCTEKDKTIVKYSLLNDSSQIFASKYMLYLPTEQELKKDRTATGTDRTGAKTKSVKNNALYPAEQKPPSSSGRFIICRLCVLGFVILDFPTENIWK